MSLLLQDSSRSRKDAASPVSALADRTWRRHRLVPVAQRSRPVAGRQVEISSLIIIQLNEEKKITDLLQHSLGGDRQSQTISGLAQIHYIIDFGGKERKTGKSIPLIESVWMLGLLTVPIVIRCYVWRLKWLCYGANVKVYVQLNYWKLMSHRRTSFKLWSIF